MFGLEPSPEILGVVILHHLGNYHGEHPQLIERIRKGLYFDDLIASTDGFPHHFRSIPELRCLIMMVQVVP